MCYQDKVILKAVETRGNTELLSEVGKNVLLEDNFKVKNYSQDFSSTKNDCPAQPKLIIFPTTNGRFSMKYYQLYEWLEYSISFDALIIYNYLFYNCFVCRHFAASSN